MKSLHIENYKNIKTLKISSLGRINLITGQNNTGKTSLLEAISIFKTEGSIKKILNLLERRGQHYRDRHAENFLKNNLEMFSSLFYNYTISFKDDFAITVGEANPLTHLNLALVKYKEIEELIEEKNEKGETINTRIVRRLRVYDDFVDEDTIFSFQVRNKGVGRGYNLNRQLNRMRLPIEVNNVQLVFPSLTDDMTNAFLWDKIVLTEKEDFIIDALKIIEPTIERLTFVNEEENMERHAVIRLKGKPNVYPLKSMGDGINRILSIILAMVNCSGGTLIIDELENGLHFTAQEKLWEIIFKVATDLNIQVFATTHSSDCIFSFARVLQQTSENQLLGKLLRLDKVEEGVEAVTYSQDELEIVLDQNIETRI
jgi:AAA15 family ATPase/GTPase